MPSLVASTALGFPEFPPRDQKTNHPPPSLPALQHRVANRNGITKSFRGQLRHTRDGESKVGPGPNHKPNGFARQRLSHLPLRWIRTLFPFLRLIVGVSPSTLMTKSGFRDLRVSLQQLLDVFRLTGTRLFLWVSAGCSHALAIDPI